jgi:hypothetical protein
MTPDTDTPQPEQAGELTAEQQTALADAVFALNEDRVRAHEAHYRALHDAELYFLKAVSRAGIDPEYARKRFLADS